MQLRTTTAVWLAILVTTGMASLGPAAHAKTWRVEKDGSGDFTIIQQALDAAADGDSILIGPGRFDDIEKRPVSFGTLASTMFINNSDLTIVGAESTMTIIGPAVQTDLFEQVGIITTIVDAGYLRTRFEHLTLENNNSLVSLDEAATFVGCKFNYRKQPGVPGGGGVRLESVSGVTFRNCSFVVTESNQSAIVSFIGGRNPNLSIIDCTFEHLVVDQCGCGAIQVEGADSLLVSGSTFVNGTTAVTARNGRGIRIINSVFEGQEAYGVFMVGASPGASEVLLTRSRFRSQVRGSVKVGSHTEFLATDCVFGAGSLPDNMGNLWFEGPQTSVVRNCDILPGVGPSARLDIPAGFNASVDLRNNYWGSTDSTQISSWILDENDQPCVGWWCPGITTEFVPFLGQSIVPTRRQTTGKLKSLFRPRN